MSSKKNTVTFGGISEYILREVEAGVIKPCDPKTICLSEDMWIGFGSIIKAMQFTAQELSEAQNREDGYIGERLGCKCYLENNDYLRTI